MFAGGGGGGTGGNGGFGGGGGGGGGGGDGTGKLAGAPGGGPFGAGGFGAGNGAAGIPGDFGLGAGGGGLGAGGDIFVAQGSSLVVDGGLLSLGSVSGGAAGANDGGNSSPDVGAGEAFGSGVFLQGNETITLAAPAGETLNVSGVIADQTGSGGNATNAGAGALVIDDAGTVELDATNTFVGGITIGSGTLDLAHTGAAGGGTIRFDAGALAFAAADVPVNQIDDFGGGDSIIVSGFAETGHSYADGVLTLDGAGGPLHLNLAVAAGAALEVAAVGGTTVVTACFAEGTRIATECGDVAVEHLQVGDAIRTCDQGAAAVVWLGHRTVDCVRHPRPHDVMPVRIVPHAFAPNQPARELLLSPDHAVFVGGSLIPVRYLINGASVAQVYIDKITYWHVELPRHGLLYAENLCCESYLDTGNRAAFANDGPIVEVFPEISSWRREAAACAPLAVSGPVVEAVRRRLRLQASQSETAVGSPSTAGLRRLA